MRIFKLKFWCGFCFTLPLSSAAYATVYISVQLAQRSNHDETKIYRKIFPNPKYAGSEKWAHSIQNLILHRMVVFLSTGHT